MKRLYSLPTDSVILECLANDTLGRNEDVARFCSIIDSFHECTVVAIDGAWGSGKTFFIKQTKMLLDSSCGNSCLDDTIVEGCERIKSMDNSPYKTLDIKQKHSTVYYDAWENDNNSDPILSIIYAVARSKQVSLRIKNDTSAYDVLKSLANCLTGRDIGALTDAIKGEEVWVDIKYNETIKKRMVDFFKIALGEVSDRLVIFIDELDRCKPSFAVSLLERVKHYFTDDRLTFVFSINQDQLQHTIKGYYGSGMNGSKYLEKLFNISLVLPEANMQRYLSHLGFHNISNSYDKIYWATIRYFNFGLRDTAKFLEYLKLTTYDLTHNNRSKWYFNDSSSFCLHYITPILIGLQLHDVSMFNTFVNGSYPTPLLEILTLSGVPITRIGSLLGHREYFNGTPAELLSTLKEGAIEVTPTERLVSIYEAIFKKDYSNHEEFTIGGMTFDENLKKRLLRLINPLSEYANIES